MNCWMRMRRKRSALRWLTFQLTAIVAMGLWPGMLSGGGKSTAKGQSQIMSSLRIEAPRLSSVFERGANIWATDIAGKPAQLTMSGRDRAPQLSPDGRSVAFIRKSSNHAYVAVGAAEHYPGDSILADQVWTIDARTGAERLLVSDRAPGEGDVVGELKRTIAHIDGRSLCFSPDGKKLYFISSAWATSGALHVVDLETGRDGFLLAANSVEVVQSGRYVGHLIVRRHRYFLGAGSYDWYWLVDSEGQEIGPIGECVDQVHMFRELFE